DGFAAGAVLGDIGIEETGSRVGFLAAGQIAEDDEERAVGIGFGLQAVLLAMQRKENLADDIQLDGIAENILGVELFGRIIRNEARVDFVGFVNGEPLQACEALEQRAVLILEAEREAITAGVDIQREIAENETLLGIVRVKFSRFDGLAVDGPVTPGWM